MYADIWERIADRIGDEVAITHGQRTVTWSQWDRHASRFAGFLSARGVGRDDSVALYLHNCPEYLEAHFAAFKIRAVPVNVNYRYRAGELAHLLGDSGSRVLVYDRTLSPVVAEVADEVEGLDTLVEVETSDPGTTGADLEGAIGWNEALRSEPAARVRRSRDDLYMIYTGGTTGLPKGVVYSMGALTDWFGGVAALTLGAPAPTSADEAADIAVDAVRRENPAVPRAVPVCPLMHGTGIWLGAIVSATCGGSVHLLTGHSFDATEAWRVVAAHRANRIVIVGDSFARPLLRELDAARDRGEPVDTSSLTALISSGAALSPESTAGFLERIPHLTILDVLGASEGGLGTAVAATGLDRRAATFTPLDGTRVFGPDDRPVEPGSGEVGLVGRSGPDVPLRYHNDPDTSARTFREIDGVRYAFAGDLATVESDGSITLLGRGSNVINTGGEKVFAEEVEEALKSHPAVEDALVVGLPDERFGHTVTAVVSRAPGADGETLDDDALAAAAVAHVHSRLAGYKTPRRVVVVARVPRAANGKADYALARRLALPRTDPTPTTTPEAP